MLSSLMWPKRSSVLWPLPTSWSLCAMTPAHLLCSAHSSPLSVPETCPAFASPIPFIRTSLAVCCHLPQILSHESSHEILYHWFQLAFPLCSPCYPPFLFLSQLYIFSYIFECFIVCFCFLHYHIKAKRIGTMSLVYCFILGTYR